MTARLALLSLLLVVTTWVGRAQPAEAQVVRAEGVVAVVGRQRGGQNVSVILRTDVDLLARISVLARAELDPIAVAEIPLGVELRTAALDQLIGEVLIEREAERVRVRSASAAEVERETQRVAERAGGEDRLLRLLAAMGADMAEVERIARRRAVIGTFLRVNLEGVAAITDTEVAQVHETGEHPFGDAPLAELSERIRTFLASRAVERSVVRWVTVLTARTAIQLSGEYSD